MTSLVFFVDPDEARLSHGIGSLQLSPENMAHVGGEGAFGWLGDVQAQGALQVGCECIITMVLATLLNILLRFKDPVG